MFTNDDLARLCRDTTSPVGLVQMNWGEFKALLARLEAAEAALTSGCKYCHLQAWRTAAGMEVKPPEEIIYDEDKPMGPFIPHGVEVKFTDEDVERAKEFYSRNEDITALIARLDAAETMVSFWVGHKIAGRAAPIEAEAYMRWRKAAGK